VRRPSRHSRPRFQTARLIRVLVIATLTGAIMVMVAFGMLGFAIVNQARQDEAGPADAIVVLGTAQWAGRPSTTFRARLDHAFDLYHAGYAQVVVLTGGIAPGDQVSEAEVGAIYLRSRGIDDAALITVPVGMNSHESLVATAEPLRERGAQNLILVSDAFHMFRVKRIASDLGFNAMASPTSTSPIRPGSPLEQRYVIRETFAYLNYLFVES
jgi:uncharacterized SAM-binding protein YcdF (DUF218 family)